MTTARRTTLVRHLSLDFGYESDVDPAVLASAILEAIEPKLVDEMGIIMVEAQTSDRGTITIYAPLDRVVTEEKVGTDPPSTPEPGAADIPNVTVCPHCGKGAFEDDGPPPAPRDPSARVNEVFVVCDDCRAVNPHCYNCCPSSQGCPDCIDDGVMCDNCRQPNVGP